MTDGAGPNGPGTSGPSGAPSPGSWGGPASTGDNQPERGWQAPEGPSGGWGPPAPPPEPGSGNQWGQPGQWGAPGGPDGPSWGPGQWGWPPAAPKPGVIPLRPLAVGEILDGTFATIRTNPAATIGVTLGAAAVVGTLVTVLSIAADEASTTTAALLTVVGLGMNLMLGIFLSGVLSVVVSEATLGSKVSVGDAVRRVAPRLAGLVGLTVVIMIFIVLGLLALVVGAVVVSVFLGLATPAYVLEGGSVGHALRRSVRLVRGAWWRTFGIMLLAAVISAILMILFSIPASLVLLSSEETFGDFLNGDLTVAGHVVNAVGNLLATTVSTPIIAGAVVLLYVDRRIRREGLDVSLAETARQRSAGAGYR